MERQDFISLLYIVMIKLFNLKHCIIFAKKIKMILDFDSNDKKCKAFEKFVNAPEDRNARKEFTRYFNQNLLKPAVKIYQKFKISENAHVYNIVASGNNKIELLTGVRDNDPSVLKVRIQDSYRKFFHFFCNETCDNLSLKKDWTGQFNQVKYIRVYEINNHDYSRA